MGTSKVTGNKSPGSILLKYWPWFVFTLVVIVYNSIYLKYGFNATDEGWLLSVAGRIVNGQIPYRDFYLLKTPLTVYIQAGLIYIFGDSYTILSARIFWAGEIWLMVLLGSTLYRKFVHPVELFFLLVLSYTITSLYISFPWYNYDSALFALMAVLMLHRKQFVLCGLASGLAFLTKQNYILLLPLFLGLSYLLKLRGADIRFTDRKTIIRISSGFMVPIVSYFLYLMINSALTDFINNIIFLPADCSQKSILFALFQDNIKGKFYALPMIVSAAIMYFTRRLFWYAILPVFLAIGSYIVSYDILFYNYSLVFIHYAFVIIILWQYLNGGISNDRRLLDKYLPIVVFSAVIQYLSGMTYSGIVFGYVGAGLFLPMYYILLKKTSPARFSKTAIAGFFALLLVFGAYYRHSHMYRDLNRKHLTAEFTTDKLRGVKSSIRNVRQIDELCRSVVENTVPGDRIFIYSDFPVLYYLTGRANATPVDWFYEGGLNDEMLDKVIESLKANPPKVAYLQYFTERDYLRRGIKPYFRRRDDCYSRLAKYIADNYVEIGRVGDIFVFVPRI